MRKVNKNLINFYIASPILMYSFFYNNAEFSSYITTHMLKNAISNEALIPKLLNIDNYANFLHEINKNLNNKQKTKDILGQFTNYFWLKEPVFCFINLVKAIKQHKIKICDIDYVVYESKLTKGFYEFLKLQKTRKKLTDKKINKLFNQQNLNFEFIINQLIKHKLI